MNKALSVSYAVISYLIFFAVFLYLIAFVGDLVVPKTVSSGAVQTVNTALSINLLLLSLFAIQHTIIARQSFKQ